MKENLFKSLLRFFSKGRSEPMIVPKQGENPTKRGYGVSQKKCSAHRKALRLRQKMTRRVNRR